MAKNLVDLGLFALGYDTLGMSVYFGVFHDNP